jgi:hypothetical protein
MPAWNGLYTPAELPLALERGLVDAIGQVTPQLQLSSRGRQRARRYQQCYELQPKRRNMLRNAVPSGNYSQPSLSGGQPLQAGEERRLCVCL